jgi:hypothetical protein
MPSSYQIQRTVGTFAFNLLLARDIYPLAHANASANKAGFKTLLAKIDKTYMNAEFWRTGGRARLYVGSSGWRELRDLMRRNIK